MSNGGWNSWLAQLNYFFPLHQSNVKACVISPTMTINDV